MSDGTVNLDIKIAGQLEITKLQLSPGDAVVARMDISVSETARRRITRVLEGFAPGVKVLVIGPEMELSVFSPDREIYGRRA